MASLNRIFSFLIVVFTFLVSQFSQAELTIFEGEVNKGELVFNGLICQSVEPEMAEERAVRNCLEYSDCCFSWAGSRFKTKLENGACGYKSQTIGETDPAQCENLQKNINAIKMAYQRGKLGIKIPVVKDPLTQ